MIVDRAVIIVLDSVGIGPLPDAHIYKDEGCDTLGNIANFVGGLNLPHLKEMGLGNIHTIKGLDKVDSPLASYGKMMEASAGKDTTTGHWEIAGIITSVPFPVYPRGFPEEVILQFEKKIGRKILGNKPASGTEIIKELGKLHMETGRPIVYTSADSVFQIAAHEGVIGLDKLYEYSRIARSILVGQNCVSRVIARPFIGSPDNFCRTANRKDFSIHPPRDTLLNFAKKDGYKVYGVGKIEDIFASSGLTDSIHIDNNLDGMKKTLELIKEDTSGIIFTNLVDFDMLFGHRNDPSGYAKALKEFDERLPEVLKELKMSDILFITADHGCDPTTHCTDHSREYVPLLVYGHKIKGGVNLGTRKSFSDIAKTVAQALRIENDLAGLSFLDDLLLS